MPTRLKPRIKKIFDLLKAQNASLTVDENNGVITVPQSLLNANAGVRTITSESTAITIGNANGDISFTLKDADPNTPSDLETVSQAVTLLKLSTALNNQNTPPNVADEVHEIAREAAKALQAETHANIPNREDRAEQLALSQLEAAKALLLADLRDEAVVVLNQIHVQSWKDLATQAAFLEKKKELCKKFQLDEVQVGFPSLEYWAKQSQFLKTQKPIDIDAIKKCHTESATFALQHQLPERAAKEYLAVADLEKTATTAVSCRLHAAALYQQLGQTARAVEILKHPQLSDTALAQTPALLLQKGALYAEMAQIDSSLLTSAGTAPSLALTTLLAVTDQYFRVDGTLRHNLNPQPDAQAKLQLANIQKILERYYRLQHWQKFSATPPLSQPELNEIKHKAETALQRANYLLPPGTPSTGNMSVNQLLTQAQLALSNAEQADTSVKRQAHLTAADQLATSLHQQFAANNASHISVAQRLEYLQCLQHRLAFVKDDQNILEQKELLKEILSQLQQLEPHYAQLSEKQRAHFRQYFDNASQAYQRFEPFWQQANSKDPDLVHFRKIFAEGVQKFLEADRQDASKIDAQIHTLRLSSTLNPKAALMACDAIIQDHPAWDNWFMDQKSKNQVAAAWVIKAELLQAQNPWLAKELCLAALRKTSADQHETRMDACLKLVTLYQQKGKAPEAKKYFEKALKALINALRDPSISNDKKMAYYQQLSNVCQTLYSAQEIAKLNPLLQAASKVLSSQMGSNALTNTQTLSLREYQQRLAVQQANASTPGG